MAEKPFPISYEQLKKLVLKAYQISKTLPNYYPSVEEIDEFLESPDFEEDQFREDFYKFCVRYVVYGFIRDEKWHNRHKLHRYVTAPNIISYMLTPLDGPESLKPHCKIWPVTMDKEGREDRQAAFEYMQSIIADQNLYPIDKPIEDVDGVMTVMAS